MRLEELLRIERLGLSVVSATSDSLRQEVTGAYITDLPDPSRFLSVGDVVLTSGVWHTGPEDAAEFVAAIARQQVAALIVGLVHLGHVPDDILEACRAHDLALVTISDKVSFKTVAETVTSTQLGAAHGLAEKGLHFSTLLADRLARGESAQTILRDFQAEFGIDCWVIDDIGTVVATAGPAPSRADVGRVWNAMLGRQGGEAVIVPAAASDDGPEAVVYTCWPITGASQEAVGALVCKDNQRRLVRDAPIIVDAVVGALRVDLELSSRWRQAGHSHVSELVRVLAEDSVSPGEVSARMRLEGLDPQQPTAVAVAEVADPRYPTATVLEMAYRILSGDDLRVIGCVVGDRAVLMINGPAPERSATDLPPAAEDTLPLLGGRQLRIGISDPHPGVGQLSASVASATERLAHLQGGGPVAIAATSELRSHRSLLSQLSERTRATFAQDLLGPLLDYDAKHGAELVTTLRIFLQNTGAWQESARQLHLHTNTLRYRISRVEELTGRALGDMDDRVDFYLALEITGGMRTAPENVSDESP